MQVESIGNSICHLAECPLWNRGEQRLYWTDILAGKLWRYEPRTGAVELYWESDMMIGGFAFTVNNDIVLCADKGVFLLSRSKSEDTEPRLSKLYDIPMADDERFNDVTTDPAGRIFAGTLTDRRIDGILYRLEKGLEPVIVLKHIGTSNGMTFSLDRKKFYHTDSHARIINKYDYDIETGDISNPEVFYHAKAQDGVPDGITMDCEGYIWVACWRGSKVIRLDPEGRIVSEISTGAIQTSSVNFGGEDMKELFITSACQGGSDLEKGLNSEGEFLGGLVYRCKTSITGRGEWAAGF